MAKRKQQTAASRAPQGLRQVQSGGLPPFHDFQHHKELDGRIVAVRKFKNRWGKEQRAVNVADGDGVVTSVIESATLRGLFDSPKFKKGARIVIRYNGVKKIKGRRNPMKQFDCYI